MKEVVEESFDFRGGVLLFCTFKDTNGPDTTFFHCCLFEFVRKSRMKEVTEVGNEESLLRNLNSIYASNAFATLTLLVHIWSLTLPAQKIRLLALDETLLTLMIYSSKAAIAVINEDRSSGVPRRE